MSLPLPEASKNDARRIGLQGIDSVRLAALLEPVPLESLQQILKREKLGQVLLRQYFRGFRVESLKRERIIQSFSRALGTSHAGELSKILIAAWLNAVPAARPLSRELMDRGEPFEGEIRTEYYDRLASALSEACLQTLADIFPAKDPCGDASVADVAATEPDMSHESEQLSLDEDEGSIPSVGPPGEGRQLAQIIDSLAASTRTFDTVAERDAWWWTHISSPLLDPSRIDRLEKLPDQRQRRREEKSWLQYTKSLATMCELEQSWSEAQAYWFATARVLARYNRFSSSNFREALHRIVLTGAVAAGLAKDTSRNGDLIDDLIQALDIPSKQVQFGAVQGLLLAGMLDDSIYQNEVTDPKLRGKFSQALLDLVASSRSLHRDMSNMKGSHLQYAAALTEYSRALSELRKLVDSFAESCTVDFLKRHRSTLLKELRRLEPFLSQVDAVAFSQIVTLLTARFSAYESSDPEVDDELFESFAKDILAALAESRSVGSHIASCLFAPLILNIGVAIAAHYRGVVRSKFPVLAVKALKPAPLSSGMLSVQIEVRNDGFGSAYSSMLQLTSMSTDVQLHPDEFNLGTLGPNHTELVEISLSCSANLELAEILCLLS